MNTVQSDPQKRSIKVKDFLVDFRDGLSNDDLMQKYHLTPAGLDRFYTLLVDRGVLDSNELEEHQGNGNNEESHGYADESSHGTSSGDTLICPSCYHAQATPFEFCPRCGRSTAAGTENAASLDKSNHETDADEETHVGRWPDAETMSPVKRTNLKGKPGQPIEIPLNEVEMEIMHPAGEPGEGVDPFDFSELQSVQPQEDEEDEIVPGLPFEYDDALGNQEGREPSLCAECDRPLFQVVHSIYTKSRSILGLAFAGVFLVLGFLGAWGVTLFQGYSHLRLVVIYLTGISLLIGSMFLVIGVFMLLLARQNVLYCDGCGRIYPHS
jgi:hypothetical protein